MHELSLAGAIAEVAERHAAQRRLLSVAVRVGALRQVVPGALRFAFELVTADSALSGATLEVEHVAARGYCRACATDGELPALPLVCPTCGSPELQITAGEELEVVEIEVEQAREVEQEVLVT